MKIVIHRERPSHRSAVRVVNERAFGQPDEADLIDYLRANVRGILSFVAEVDGAPVGHILFSPVLIDGAPHVRAAGLGPLAVLPEFQNRGIGTALTRRGLLACRRSGYAVVVVIGHHLFYPRFGFEPASKYGLRCEFPVPEESFMVTELRPGALDGAQGLVRYHEAFITV
jgi:putative acetyltransferase